MSSFNGQHITCSKMQECRERRRKSLLRLGWVVIDGLWQSPRTGHRYDLTAAIDIEALRGTWGKEWRDAYRPPQRDRKRERTAREQKQYA